MEKEIKISADALNMSTTAAANDVLRGTLHKTVYFGDSHKVSTDGRILVVCEKAEDEPSDAIMSFDRPRKTKATMPATYKEVEEGVFIDQNGVEGRASIPEGAMFSYKQAIPIEGGREDDVVVCLNIEQLARMSKLMNFDSRDKTLSLHITPGPKQHGKAHTIEAVTVRGSRTDMAGIIMPMRAHGDAEGDPTKILNRLIGR